MNTKTICFFILLISISFASTLTLSNKESQHTPNVQFLQLNSTNGSEILSDIKTSLNGLLNQQQLRAIDYNSKILNQTEECVQEKNDIEKNLAALNDTLTSRKNLYSEFKDTISNLNQRLSEVQNSILVLNSNVNDTTTEFDNYNQTKIENLRMLNEAKTASDDVVSAIITILSVNAVQAIIPQSTDADTAKFNDYKALINKNKDAYINVATTFHYRDSTLEKYTSLISALNVDINTVNRTIGGDMQNKISAFSTSTKDLIDIVQPENSVSEFNTKIGNFKESIQTKIKFEAAINEQIKNYSKIIQDYETIIRNQQAQVDFLNGFIADHEEKCTKALANLNKTQDGYADGKIFYNNKVIFFADNNTDFVGTFANN